MSERTHEALGRLGSSAARPKWACAQCGKVSRGQRRWCLLWGPIYWRDKKRVRVAVCAGCKKLMGKFA